MKKPPSSVLYNDQIHCSLTGHGDHIVCIAGSKPNGNKVGLWRDRSILARQNNVTVCVDCQSELDEESMLDDMFLTWQIEQSYSNELRQRTEAERNSTGPWY